MFRQDGPVWRILDGMPAGLQFCRTNMSVIFVVHDKNVLALAKGAQATAHNLACLSQ
jgi:hypothetical protein